MAVRMKSGCLFNSLAVMIFSEKNVFAFRKATSRRLTPYHLLHTQRRSQKEGLDTLRRKLYEEYDVDFSTRTALLLKIFLRDSNQAFHVKGI